MKKTKLLVGGAAGIALLALGGLMATDSGRAEWRRFNGHPGQSCMDYQAKLLKDPFSARYDGNQQIDGPKVKISYYARNGFGAYVPGETACVMHLDEVDAQQTERHRDIDTATIELKERLDRLRRQNNCLAAESAAQFQGRATPKVDCESLR